MLSETLQKRLINALTSQVLARELIDAVNQNTTFATTTSKHIVGCITATNVSQTVDFGALAVGDYVVRVPMIPGAVVLIGPIATAGTLGVAAVVGDIYVIARANATVTPSTVTL